MDDECQVHLRPERVCPVLEGGDHAEVPATARRSRRLSPFRRTSSTTQSCLQAGHVPLQPRATRTAHAGSLGDTGLAPAAAGYRLLRLNSSRWESNQAMTSLRFQRLCLPTL